MVSSKKAILFLILFLSIGLQTFRAQWALDYGFNIGVANYLGEIGGKEKDAQPFLLDLKLGQTRWGLGGFIRYNIAGNFYIRGDINTFRIQGADSLSINPTRVGRNLSFKNDVFELSARAEYVFYRDYDVGRTGNYEVNLSMFAFAGGGVFWHNPKAMHNGQWYALQPLQTEGVAYSRIQPSIPVGLGFHYTIRKTQRIGFEVGYRFTFTDYLDDVSGFYRDTTGTTDIQKIFISRPVEVDIYDNLPHPNNYKYPSPRGNPKNMDGFMTAMVSYSTVIKGKYKNKKFNATKRRYKYITSKKKKRRAKAKF